MKRTRRDMDKIAFGAHAIDLPESDPMASAANLVDAMLVFACGLMMALVMRYNVNLSNIQDISIDQDLSEVENIDQMVDDMRAEGSGYTELGTVYQD